MSTTESDTETTTDVPMYPALRTLERATPPVRYGRPPYWRAPHPNLEADPFIPSWNWRAVRDFAPGAEVVTLDANAAYLGAIGGVTIGHSQLEHTGALDHGEPRDVPPGYFRITVPYWPFSGTIVSPLGDSSRLQTEATVWILQPTLTLLLELQAEGYIGGFEIIDSHTANVATNFRTWAQKLGSVRAQCLDQIDVAHPDQVRPEKCRCTACKRYNAFKEGYSAALSMMLKGERCATHRPDWARTVYAAHSANMWRKAWRYTMSGRVLVSMGHVDEIQVLREDLPAVLNTAKPPFRLDSTGRSVGALKVKGYSTLDENTAGPAQAPVMAEDWEDIV